MPLAPTLAAVVLALLAGLLPARRDDPTAPPTPTAAAAAAAAPAAPAAPALQRVAVVGASASAGFRLVREVGAHTNMADVLDAILLGEHAPVADAASSALFRSPLRIGEGRVEKALAAEPTLVVAIDFLFWFTYGSVRDDDERFALLEQGLALLERFACPLLIAEVPDMSPAVGKMLSARQVPETAVRARLNARIRAWAGERERVVLVPMETFVDRLRNDREIRLRGYVVPGGSTRRLLQSDDLHPTLEGLAALTVLALHALSEARPALVPDAGVLWDPAEVARRVHASKETERQAAAERKRQREESRRRRAEERATSGDRQR